MNTHRIQINHCLKSAVVLVSAFLLSSPAYPDADKTVVSTKTESEKDSTEKADNVILSIVASDWNDDKHIDSAVLLKSGDQADLYFYLGNATGDMGLKLVKKNMVWSGALAGTLPQINAAKDGGLYIYSLNDAVGRNRWHQRLSVDYRDNDFIVTGYIYDERDTLDPKAYLVCDVNLLTGKGIKNKIPFKIEAQKIKVSDWSDEKIPKQCRD